MVARGFPRCKPNRIPDKRLENKMSENGKPDKMPDNLNRILTLTGSGPFMSLFTLTHTHTLSPCLYTLSLSLLINTFLSFCTHSISTSLSLSTHTPCLYLSTHLSIAAHTPSLSISKHTPSLSAHTFHLSLSLYPSLSLNTHTPSHYLYTHSLSLYTLLLFQNTLLPSLCTHFPSLSLSLSVHSLSLSLHTHTPSIYLFTHSISLHTVPFSFSLHTVPISISTQIHSLSVSRLHFRFFSDSCWNIYFFVYNVKLKVSRGFTVTLSSL